MDDSGKRIRENVERNCRGLLQVLQTYCTYCDDKIKSMRVEACGTYGREEKCIKDFGGENWGNRALGRPRSRWKDDI